MKAMVSIIVPVYITKDYLRQCIESLLSQTYRSVEIILVDDGSPDECLALCDAYASKDKRIRVIHKENGGLSSAREAGIQHAHGDYIMVVDSDDWLEPDTVADCIEVALKTKRIALCLAMYGNILQKAFRLTSLDLILLTRFPLQRKKFIVGLLG